MHQGPFPLSRDISQPSMKLAPAHIQPIRMKRIEYDDSGVREKDEIIVLEAPVGTGHYGHSK